MEAKDAKSSISVAAPSEPLADENLPFIAEKDANSTIDSVQGSEQLSRSRWKWKLHDRSYHCMSGHITESDSENDSQNQTQ